MDVELRPQYIDWSISAGKKWIKSADFQVIRDAEALLASAREQAAHILETARLREQQEKERGYQDGLAAGQQEIIDQVAQLAARAAHDNEKLKEKLAAMVSDSVTSILSDVPGDEWYSRALTKVSRYIKEQTYLTLTVDKASYPAAQKAVALLSESNVLPEFVQLEMGDSLAPGSCIMVSELGRVDASFQVQIKAVFQALESSFGVPSGTLFARWVASQTTQAADTEQARDVDAT